MEKQRILLFSTLLISSLLLMTDSLAPLAYAHKPIWGTEGTTVANAYEISDHQISWAVFEDPVSESGDFVRYYKFNADEGERLYTELLVPTIERYEKFQPSLAIAGPGIGSARPEGGNFVTNTSDEGQFTVNGLETVVFDYQGSVPSNVIYEEFGQVTYWEKQKVIIENLPASGTYYLVVFDSVPGKYALAVGEIEDFSFIDTLTILPTAWVSNKLYFEDYSSVFIFAAIIIGIVATAVTIVLYKRKRKQMLQR